MKYVIVQGDGMADWPGENGEPTPLEAARTPHMDRLASCGEFGRIQTIPPGLPPGSDVGNLSLFGYDPQRYYTGRAPLEAAAMGLQLAAGEQALRMNLVCLAGAGEAQVMADYAGAHISSEEAAELVAALASQVTQAGLAFHAGVSYRHLLTWREGPQALDLTPPHDISDRPVAPHLPRGEGAAVLREVMELSAKVFAQHPVNAARRAKGKQPITQVWFWGPGAAVSTPPFAELYGLQGSCISAVDLVRGVACCAGFEIIHAPGATGFLDTDYASKARCAVTALQTHDLVFVHIEAPDEAGHMGNRAEKIKAIEQIDQKVLGHLLQALPEQGPFTLLLTSDHATPVATKTHSADPPPFALATARQLQDANGSTPRQKYGETDATASGVIIQAGYSIIARMQAHAQKWG